MKNKIFANGLSITQLEERFEMVSAGNRNKGTWMEYPADPHPNPEFL